MTNGDLPEDIKKSFDAWSGCIAGALERNEYLAIIKKAGFKNAEIINEKSYSEEGMDKRIIDTIISIQIRAVK